MAARARSVVFTAAANTWTEITITRGELGSPAAISRLNFMNSTAGSIGMVTFDHIRIEPDLNASAIFDDDFESGDTSRWSSWTERFFEGGAGR